MKKLYVLLSALILSSVAPLYASYCIHCGKNLPDEANFCSNCGQAVYNANTASNNYIPVSSNNNGITTTRTKVVYNDGVRTTSSVKTITAYTPNTDTQIVYKNEYYYPVPVTQTVVRESSCDPLLGLMIWGVIHAGHHHHHRHIAPPPARHMPPPPASRLSHPGVRRAGFRH